MVELNDPCRCCGHKRRRPVLDRLKSCPVSFTAGDAIPRPAKFARSSSLPSHSCVAALREDPRLNAAAGPSFTRIPTPALSSLVLRPATSFPITSEETPVPDNKEEEKVETDNDKNHKRKVKIWGGESVKITIKCKCGSVQKIEF